MGIKQKVTTTVRATCDKCEKEETYEVPGAVTRGDARLPQHWAMIAVHGMPAPLIIQMQDALEGNIPPPDVSMDVASILNDWDDDDDNNKPKQSGRIGGTRIIPCKRMLCGECIEKLWECVGLPQPITMDEAIEETTMPDLKAKQAKVPMRGGAGGVGTPGYAIVHSIGGGGGGSGGGMSASQGQLYQKMRDSVIKLGMDPNVILKPPVP